MEVPKIARQRFLDDVTNSVDETFRANSLKCAAVTTINLTRFLRRTTKGCLAHWRSIEALLDAQKPPVQPPPLEVRRDAVEEKTGEKFSFSESLHAYAEFVPDLQPGDVPHTPAP